MTCVFLSLYRNTKNSNMSVSSQLCKEKFLTWWAGIFFVFSMCIPKVSMCIPYSTSVIKWLMTKVPYCFHIWSHSQIFFKIDVLKKFENSLCSKVSGKQSAILLKQNGRNCFPVNFAKHLFLQNTYRRLLKRFSFVQQIHLLLKWENVNWEFFSF